VYSNKYAGVVQSRAHAGLGGAFLVLEAANIYREGQTNGRGFIALAALIFGNWRPVGVALGSALFGFSDALQLRQESAVHALLLFVALGALLFALRALYQRRWKVAAVLAAFAFAFWLYYVTTDQVPVQFVFFTPHLTTLLVLSFATQRLRMPAADGLVYRKGQVQ
jgi:simple sugar transport system permease protein